MINLQTELIKEFAEVVHDVSGNKQQLSDNIVYGTLSKEGAHNYVKIDGSDLLTPVTVAASADSGDRVGVIIKNHTAIAGFNFSSPSANTRTIENLVSAVNGKFDRIDATYITAEKANITFATIQSLEAVNGKFDTLDVKYLSVENAKITYATIESLTATNVKVETITGNFASFKTGEFEDLKAKKADIDLANVVNAWIQNGIIKDGSIGAAAIHDGAITNVKIADATIEAAKIKSINADVITAGTLKTDRLIITGEDGEDSIVKVINIVNGVPEAEVNNTKIQAASVDVADLSAFKAKIALFDLSGNAIYSGKTSIKDPASGIYISTTGIGIGDGGLTGKDESPIQMYADGTFKLIGKNSSLDFNTVTGMLDMEVSSLKVASKTVAIKDDLDSVTDRVTEAESKITQNADNINLRVEKSGVISAINQSSETISIDASKINLSGYVTVSALAGAGQTTVNGANITTGVVKSSNYKYVTGGYADSGVAIDLDNGLIVSKGFVVNGSTGDVFFKGKLEGPSGYIGGFNIIGSDLIVNKTLADGTTAKFTLSGTGNYGNMMEIYNGPLAKNVFSIDYLGYLHAEDASFNTISASSIAISSGLSVKGDVDMLGRINGTLYGSASSLRNAGTNIIGMVASDTITTWAEQSNSVHFISNEYNQIVNDNPDTWGLLLNLTKDSDIHQIWCTQPTGALFHRGGNSAGWSGTWREIVDSSNYAKITGESYTVGSSWKSLTPYAGDNVTALGMTGYRYTRLYAASATISTSDECEKNILSEITEPYEKVFMELKPVLYMWKNFENEQRVHDRVHCGLGAQSTIKTAEKYGLSTQTFALVCRDDLDQPTADGRMERWGLAYEELIPMNIHMTQKVINKAAEQEEKTKILEAHVQMLQTALDQAFVEIAKLKKAVG